MKTQDQNSVKPETQSCQMAVMRWLLIMLNTRLIKHILGFFKKEEKDEYVEYLKKSTNKKWIKYLNKSYLCEEKNFYLELDDNGNAKCTRDARLLPYQTCSGPFCNWFAVPKQNVHLYVK